MRAVRHILLLLVLCLPFAAWGQNDDNFAFKPDSVRLVDASELDVDTLPIVPWRPDPLRAVWLGAICPGLGQMYNRSWWKVPIVYGALMGCGYAIMTNQQAYAEYKTAYIDLYNDMHSEVEVDISDPTKSYNAIMPDGYTMARYGGASSYLSKLEKQENNYRRYRDLSIVVTVVVYALSLVDAYVDAQLFDFDISPDLSMQVEPSLHYDPMIHRTNGEVHLAIKF